MMNLMELRDVSSDLMTDATSIQTVYQDILQELEIISKIIATHKPSANTNIQTLMNQISSLREQILSISNQCSDSIMRYANDSGEILDKLSVNVNKAIDEFVNKIAV